MNHSHASAPASGQHDHMFLGDGHRRNEKRVWLVIALTAAMMLIEIVAGTIYGSMALVADGWHMSTHAAAMLIAALAYGYARRHARDTRFSFGTGKLGDLAGFASAIVLALVSLMIGWQSLVRLADPVAIQFNEAIGIAVVGLAVNLASAWLLKDDAGHHHHGGGHRHDHGDAHTQGHGHDHHRHAGHGARDNNLRSAYMHVLADALTSVLAIVALVLGRSYGWHWADPVMGIVGALVIANWSWGLVRDAGGALLDKTPAGSDLADNIRSAMEDADTQVTDLHVWQVGPGHHAVIVSLLADHPQPPSGYKSRLAHLAGLSHVTIEVEPATPSPA
ncbi:CDF family Co(II)/Ni(II) efflux transporter DmeF [Achromobacter pestifer]|uniref:Cadmium, cobalt and zinc/H(+)-K(+) antiporter n=1 Tax=Achromobacter pestifer TaxID=1353889 RepID=A0A6S6ZEK1_9BURK|nr:CDF family Co(II)/Ni(II) efflux transporter DmeF [Achromobacter pestifer]CAB3642845.1 Cadmium, cobalt and zinc/H(+)-K(+) antiporter [Achromobacter pestifer]